MKLDRIVPTISLIAVIVGSFLLVYFRCGFAYGGWWIQTHRGEPYTWLIPARMGAGFGAAILAAGIIGLSRHE